MVKIALLDDYQNAALKLADWDSIPGAPEITVFDQYIGDAPDLAERLEPFDIIGIMRERTRFPGSLLARLPNLKLLVTTAARNASVDVEAARAHAITVCGTLGQGQPTAELTWGLILGLARSIPYEDRRMREGYWQTTLGRTIHGMTLGVVGLGRLGSQVARVGKAFGMEIAAWSQNLTAERAAECGARLVSKEALFQEADIVTIHLVLSARSRGLVGAEEIALMKPTAYLVNTSRGPIVDEAALVDALTDRRIAGAALDVFDQEPLPADHPLRALDNTVLSPHLGYVSEDNYRIFYRGMVEDIIAFLDGAPIRVVT